MPYTNPNFVDNSTPPLSAENMNALANAVESSEVANGGTGRKTLARGSILTGNGTNPIGMLTGTGAVYAQVNGTPLMGTLPVNCGGTGATSLRALKSAMGLANAGFIVQSSTPSAANRTKLWINSSNNTMNYWNGSSWVAIRGVFGA